jgi:hypothetical protein
LLFARRAIEECKVPRTYVALSRGSGAVSPAVVERIGGTVLFAQARDLELWSLRLRHCTAAIEIWRAAEISGPRGIDTPEGFCLPLVVWRNEKIFPAHAGVTLQVGDIVHFAVYDQRRQEAHDWLREQGWSPEFSTEQEAMTDEAPQQTRELATVD